MKMLLFLTFAAASALTSIAQARSFGHDSNRRKTSSSGNR